MSYLLHATRVAHLIDPHDVEILDVLGPTIQVLTEPGADDGSPCIMRGTIPPGGAAPLHSHPDPETFILLSGEAEALAEWNGDLGWAQIEPSGIFHVPSGAKHAWRNRSQQWAVLIVVSTSRMGRFFRAIGTPVAPGRQPSGPPSADQIRRLLETSERYGYWVGTPDENARVGLVLPSAS